MRKLNLKDLFLSFGHLEEEEASDSINPILGADEFELMARRMKKSHRIVCTGEDNPPVLWWPAPTKSDSST